MKKFKFLRGGIDDISDPTPNEERIRVISPREHDGLYYVGDIADVDGDGWVTYDELLRILSAETV